MTLSKRLQTIVKIIIALECIAQSYCFYLLHTTIDDKEIIGI